MSQQDAPAITKAALEGKDELAVEAVDMFLAIIGAEAGYMGLRALATGGVYICGGITPKVCNIIAWWQTIDATCSHLSTPQPVIFGSCSFPCGSNGQMVRVMV